MRSIIRALLIACIAALALAPSASAAEERPISGWFTVAVVPVDQRCGPNAITIGFEGAGVASHLGRMTGNGSNCTEPTLGAESVEIWDGTATFVAADGSTLTAAYSGVQAAPVGGAAETIVTNTVVGGTGRFAGASGSWTQTGTIDFVTGSFTGTFSGWIAY